MSGGPSVSPPSPGSALQINRAQLYRTCVPPFPCSSPSSVDLTQKAPHHARLWFRSPPLEEVSAAEPRGLSSPSTAQPLTTWEPSPVIFLSTAFVPLAPIDSCFSLHFWSSIYSEVSSDPLSPTSKSSDKIFTLLGWFFSTVSYSQDWHEMYVPKSGFELIIPWLHLPTSRVIGGIHQYTWLLQHFLCQSLYHPPPSPT